MLSSRGLSALSGRAARTWKGAPRFSTAASHAGGAPPPTWQQLRVVFIASAAPMVGFGFMDNLVMIRAGDAIDNSIGVRFGLATLTAAAFGQVFSDVAGVMFGGVVEDFFTRIGMPVPTITAAQRQLRSVKLTGTVGAVCGVVVGCLLGMVNLAFMDLEAAERLKKQKELDTIFRTVIAEGNESMQAERTSLFVVDHAKQEVWSRVATGLGDREIRVPIEGSVVGSVVADGKTLNIVDAYKDKRFNRHVDAQTGFHTRSILCVPVAAPEDPKKVIAVVEMINKKDNVDGAFHDEDQRAAEMLARHVGIFFHQFGFADAG